MKSVVKWNLQQNVVNVGRNKKQLNGKGEPSDVAKELSNILAADQLAKKNK